jgi:hypothetical protein
LYALDTSYSDDDGKIWIQSLYSPPTYSNIQAFAFNGIQWLAVGSRPGGPQVYYNNSVDRLDSVWRIPPAGPTDPIGFTCCAWSSDQGLWFIGSSTQVYTSPDAITWTIYTTPFSAASAFLQTSQGLLVAKASLTTVKQFYLINSVTTEVMTPNTIHGNVTSLAGDYVNSVLVGTSEELVVYDTLTSTETFLTLPEYNIYDIAWNGTVSVAIPFTTPNTLFVVTGTTFVVVQPKSLLGNDFYCYHVVWNGLNFVLSGFDEVLNCAQIALSPDGLVWTFSQSRLPAVGTDNLPLLTTNIWKSRARVGNLLNGWAMSEYGPALI